MPAAGGSHCGAHPRAWSIIFVCVCILYHGHRECGAGWGPVHLSSGLAVPQPTLTHLPQGPPQPNLPVGASPSSACPLRPELWLAQPPLCFSRCLSLRPQNIPFSLASPIHMRVPGACDSAPSHLHDCSHPHPPAPPHPWTGCGPEGQQTPAVQPPWALFRPGW